jgi:YaaC-like protein
VFRVCPHPSVIHTDRPEAEAWNQIYQLTSLSGVFGLLDSRLRSDFFAELRQNIEHLNRRKCEFNSSQSNQNQGVEVYEILSPTSNNLSRNAEEITVLAKQAIEFYKASQQVTLLTKPILLYYSYARLARILYLSTYEMADGKAAHGLTLDNNESFTIQRKGSFQRFHDSYNWNPSIYLDTCEFNWKNLIIGKATNIYGIVLNLPSCNKIELTREIMFAYAMSWLARYSVRYWNELIDGKKEVTIWQINEYLTSTQTLFPNLIYNQITGIQYYYYPVGHELFEVSQYVPNLFPWLL